MPHSNNTQHLAELHDVTKVYQQGDIQVAALRGISLVLEREQFCFIVWVFRQW